MEQQFSDLNIREDSETIPIDLSPSNKDDNSTLKRVLPTIDMPNVPNRSRIRGGPVLLSVNTNLDPGELFSREGINRQGFNESPSQAYVRTRLLERLDKMNMSPYLLDVMAREIMNKVSYDVLYSEDQERIIEETVSKMIVNG